MQAIGGPATPGKTPLLHSTHAQGTTDQPTKPKSNQSNPASHAAAAAASPSTTSTLDFLMYIRCRLTSPPQTEDFNSDQLNCAAFRYANLSPRTKKLYRAHKPSLRLGGRRGFRISDSLCMQPRSTGIGDACVSRSKARTSGPAKGSSSSSSETDPTFQ
ncbi:putative tetrathionate reductase complex: response regulator [Anopheles sinensis]|uniref:Putative tetrathionate reductase complex: response regulator n=1 Tax=Anopheles sinensis TaxID=74873 RepID=A0A084W632_ANOSI|nr:putative tetrathionate reductase complex: response regulator [Anopheles sinensis]